MCKYIKKLCIDLAQAFLNKMLKREVVQQVLGSHNITLPVCRDTARRWMHLCRANTRRISKNYYNDLHQDDAVVKYWSEHIDKREGLYGRMAMWKLLYKAEEDAFMARAADLPMCNLIKPGVKVCKCYVHYTNNCKIWMNDGALCPDFTPSVETDAGCKYGHTPKNCKCRCEAMEVG